MREFAVLFCQGEVVVVSLSKKLFRPPQNVSCSIGFFFDCHCVRCNSLAMIPMCTISVEIEELTLEWWWVFHKCEQAECLGNGLARLQKKPRCQKYMTNKGKEYLCACRFFSCFEFNAGLESVLGPRFFCCFPSMP